MTDDIIKLAQVRLGYQFKDVALLELALTHASVAESRLVSNERMEFLGDAILGLIVCERTYQLYPHLLEGEMTKIKSTVVSRTSCALLARQIGLSDCLWLGKGMRVHETLPLSLAAAVLEAAIAAIYLDAGFDRVREFVLPLVGPLIERAFDSGHQENFKSILQQHAQQNLHDTPSYVVLEQKGPDHAKNFHICVQIGEKRYASCWGQSKKQAEQQAALLALYEMGITVADQDGRIRVVDPSATNGTNPPNGSDTNGHTPQATRAPANAPAAEPATAESTSPTPEADPE